MNPITSIRKKLLRDRTYLVPEIVEEQPEIMAPARWRIVNLLAAKGRASIADITEVLDSTSGAAYHHLDALEDAGVVRSVNTNSISGYGKRWELTLDLEEYIARSFNLGSLVILLIATAMAITGIALWLRPEAVEISRRALLVLALGVDCVAGYLWVMLRGRITLG